MYRLQQFGREAGAQNSKHFNNTGLDSNTIIAIILEFVHDFGSLSNRLTFSLIIFRLSRGFNG